MLLSPWLHGLDEVPQRKGTGIVLATFLKPLAQAEPVSRPFVMSSSIFGRARRHGQRLDLRKGSKRDNLS